MKNTMKIALAVALIGGVSAAALSLDSASARGFGWNNDGPQQGQQFGGHHGSRGFKGGARGMGPAQRMQDLDANKDGTLTKEELVASLEKKITDNDTDGDNAITLEEFKAEWAKQTQSRMVRAHQMFDPDGDGKVTLEELTKHSDFMFERMDRNNDGKIDQTDRPDPRQGRGQNMGQGRGQNMGQNGDQNWGKRGGGRFGPNANQQEPQAPVPPIAQAPQS